MSAADAEESEAGTSRPGAAPARCRIDHPLSPLLTPRSVAVVGASPRQGNTGLGVLRALRELRFDGPLHPVNPRYAEVAGLACYPSMAELPAPVDLAVLAVADARIEGELRRAIEAGAGAASIFGSCLLPGDGRPALAARLAAMLREAGMAANGANCMGFCNFAARIHVTSHPFAWQRPGRVAVLAQSGSVFGALTASRLGVSLAVSMGSELATGVADYMDYVLELGSARVLALFLETVRDGEAFRAALDKAAERDVPVVALKAGRSEMAAAMAIGHSGALVGDDRAIDAVFRRHGVLRAATLDELVASSLLMERARDIGPGGLAAIHDSGGEREMVADLAADLGLAYARIGGATAARLSERLEYGLAAENPCDAYGSGHDFEGVMRDCFAALMADPETALGLFFLDVQQHNPYSAAQARACAAAAATTQKPVALATNVAGLDHRELAADFTHRLAIPVLDGTVPALKAAAHALWRRDWKARPRPSPPAICAARQARWRARLARPFDEAEGFALLADYGIATVPHAVVASEAQAVAAARRLGLPAVLKTAAPGQRHKSEAGGVHLRLADEEAVAAAWRDLARRLGPRALVAPMMSEGVEAAAGIVCDPQFGPLALVGAGGVLVELLDDAAALPAPAPAWEVEDALAERKLWRLLAGVRGRRPAAAGRLVETVVRLSLLAFELGDSLAELDVNPVLVTEDEAIALDALVVGKAARRRLA